MTPQEKLVKIMEIKNDIINKHLIKTKKCLYTKQPYFINEDKKFLLERLSTKDAKDIIEEMIFEIEKEIKIYILTLDSYFIGLEACICPFCIMTNMVCYNCVYSENRNGEECTDEFSDYYKYDKIYKELKPENRIQISTIMNILKE